MKEEQRENEIKEVSFELKMNQEQFLKKKKIKIFIYVFEREKEKNKCKWGKGRGKGDRDSWARSTPSTEPDVGIDTGLAGYHDHEITNGAEINSQTLDQLSQVSQKSMFFFLLKVSSNM